MTIELLSMLKAAHNSGEILPEFAYRLGTYSHDFLWTRNEMLSLWKYISENLIEEKEDFFHKLSAIIHYEKFLRQLPQGDREFWRQVLEYGEDEPMQEAMFSHFLANKHKNYLSEFQRRVKAVNEGIQAETDAFRKLMPEAAVRVHESRIEVFARFLRTIDTGKKQL
jgi:hypothetical protein